MFSFLIQHKLSYFADYKCFPSYYNDNWNFEFEQCIDISPFRVKFNL